MLCCCSQGRAIEGQPRVRYVINNIYTESVWFCIQYLAHICPPLRPPKPCLISSFIQADRLAYGPWFHSSCKARIIGPHFNFETMRPRDLHARYIYTFVSNVNAGKGTVPKGFLLRQKKRFIWKYLLHAK